MLPKTIKLTFLLLLFSLFVTAKVFAQTEAKSWAVQTPEDFANCLDSTFTGTAEGQQICGEAYSGMFVPMNLIYGANCMLGAVNCTNPSPTPSPSALQNMYYNRSLLGQTSNLISSLYTNPPANTIAWVADVASNIGVVPKAYAQGIGFSALQPLLGLWKVMRNVAYVLLILVLLAIGLMIMFRTKIDPKTAISVQSAIPRVVITLILITFSYPLAGLMIDLMYLVLFLGISIVGPLVPTTAGLAPDVSGLQAEFALGGGLTRLFASIPGAIIVEGLISIVGIALIPLTVGGRILTGLKTFTTTVTGALTAANIGRGLLASVAGIGGIVALLVIIAFIFALIRIFFILLNAYIQIIISIIFAPILLLGQAIPGQNSFSSWLRNLLANLVVFPATAILILVADIVSAAFYPGATPKPQWVPPLLGDWGPTITGVLIPLGFALVIPQLVLSIKKAFGAKPVVPISGAVGKIVGQPIGVVQQIAQTVGSYKLAFGGGGGGRPHP